MRTMIGQFRGAPRSPRTGFTLIEIMIVVVLLGIAGAMVIPSMRSLGVLRIQAAVRTIVSDMTFIQSEALANQSRYVMVFGRVAQNDPTNGLWQMTNGNGYTIFDPPPGKASIDTNSTADVLFDPLDYGRPLSRNFDDKQFAGARITNVDINNGSRLIFDELGGPTLNLTGDEPGTGGSLSVVGPDSMFTIRIEAFTGRIEVDRVNQ